MLLIGWHFRLEFCFEEKGIWACQTNVFTLAGTDNVKKAHFSQHIYTAIFAERLTKTAGHP
jgi:hypothetical protein